MFTAIDNSQQDLLFDHMKKVLQRFDDSQVTSNLPLQGKNIKLQKLVYEPSEESLLYGSNVEVGSVETLYITVKHNLTHHIMKYRQNKNKKTSESPKCNWQSIITHLVFCNKELKSFVFESGLQ